MKDNKNSMWITTKELAKLRGVTSKAIGKAANKGKIPTYLDKSKGGRGVRYVQIDGKELELYRKTLLVPNPKEPKEPSLSYASGQLDSVELATLPYTDQQKNIALYKAEICSHINEQIAVRLYPKELIYSQAKIDVESTYKELLQLLNKDQISTRALKRWVKLYNESKKNYEALIPKYGATNRTRMQITDDEKYMLIKLLFNPNRIKIGEAIRIIKQKDRSGEIESPSSEYVLRRASDDLKAQRLTEWHLSREGETSFKNKILKSVKRDWTDIKVGDVWISDGKKLDYTIIDPITGKPKRMTLILIMDACSRYVVGAAIGNTEDTKTIAMAFRMAVINFGRPPKIFYIDNGKGYRSTYFKGVKRLIEDSKHIPITGLLERLGVQVIHAEIYNAKAKPIERLNKTFHNDYEHKKSSFVGTSTSDKPANKKANEDWIKKQFPIIHTTLEEEILLIQDYFNNDYANTPHKRLNGKTPKEVYFAGKPDVVFDEERLDYLMLVNAERVVSKQGIMINKGHYYSKELVRHIGSRVLVKYDLWNPKYIKIYTKLNKFICTAFLDDCQASDLSNEDSQTRLKAERKLQKEILDETKNSVEELIAESSNHLASKKPLLNDADQIPLFAEKNITYPQETAVKIIDDFVQACKETYTIKQIHEKTSVHKDTIRKRINELEGKQIDCIDQDNKGRKKYITKQPKTNKHMRNIKSKSKNTLKPHDYGKDNKKIIEQCINEQSESFTSEIISDLTGFGLREINKLLKQLADEGTIIRVTTENPSRILYINKIDENKKFDKTHQYTIRFE